MKPPGPRAPASPTRRPGTIANKPGGPSPRRWGEPRNAVLALLGAALILGGGRRWLAWSRARAMLGRLERPGVDADTIATAADHGRAGVMDLFRLLETGATEVHRGAAGRALALLWARDELVVEEEKAVVRRGYQVHWHARRRYPRALRAEIPIQVDFGVPFLADSGAGARADNLEWSYRITGARRAHLETPSPWQAGPGLAAFRLVPGDFESHGPHHLILQARARTVGLTETWELDLPHTRFTFEFDPLLQINALLALPDEGRAELVRRAVRWAPPRSLEEAPGGPGWLALGPSFAVRNPPRLEVAHDLPGDLAHTIALEVEGVEGRFPAGDFVALGLPEVGNTNGPRDIGPLSDFPQGAIERPGPRRVRAWLDPAPELGWADPRVRSLWPGTVVTDWAPVEVMRL